jgi:hypothetical protein
VDLLDVGRRVAQVGRQPRELLQADLEAIANPHSHLGQAPMVALARIVYELRPRGGEPFSLSGWVLDWRC